MSSPRAQAAVEQLYESANVRDELTDDEADALLKWAEAELARLDKPETDDDAYSAQVDSLLSLLKQINRYAGRQGQATAQGMDEAPAKIAEMAAALGHSTQPEQIAGAGTGEPSSTIHALTALLSETTQPAEAPAQTNPADASAQADDTAVTEAATPQPTPPDSPDSSAAWLPFGDDPVDL